MSTGEKSSSISIVICGLIPRDESLCVNRGLIKDVNRILEYLCLKHILSFIDHSNCWSLQNGNLDPSLSFRDCLHLIEEGNLKLIKLIINSIALTNNAYLSSSTGKKYSFVDTCKNKVPVSFASILNEADFPTLSLPVQA